MKIMPCKTIGIIGGGQLGRMLAQAAKSMGYTVIVLDPTPNCPCAQVCDKQIIAAYNHLPAIKELAALCDVITYEFENIDFDALAYLEKNAYLPQGSHVLNITQHRFREKTAISNLGIPVPEFCLIPNEKILAEKVYYPSVLKTTMGGYDGKGQVVLKTEEDLPRAMELASNNECILEKWMHFSMEVSVIVARSTTGETKTFPVSENIHINNILHQSIVPARISKQIEDKALQYGKKIAQELDAIGLLAIEMFVVDDEIYINELAPRPHNSGHYTMDACITGQFEQHIRAVCGLPLGHTELTTPVVMANILGDHLQGDETHKFNDYIPLLESGKLHIYGKEQALNNRKMGHINMLGNIDESLALLQKSKIWETFNNDK